MYAVEREIEDIEALIAEAGGSAAVFGYSSGAQDRFTTINYDRRGRGDSGDTQPMRTVVSGAVADRVLNAPLTTMIGGPWPS